MKLRTFLTILSFAAIICSCSNEEEETYSCNKKLNNWAHKNISSIRSMQRETWLKLDENYKNTAYSAFTADQKMLFWKDKIRETLEFDWTEQEADHIYKLYTYLDERPDFFTVEYISNPENLANYVEFIKTWKRDAIYNLDWTEEQVYAICYTGNRLVNKAGDIELMKSVRLKTVAETVKPNTCDCNTTLDGSCKTGCSGGGYTCGALKNAPCNGKAS